MSRYNIDSPEKYSQLYKESVNEPEVFWSELASNNFLWEAKWSKVLDWDFRKAKVSWFKDAKLNITINCIDRHVKNHPDKTAIIFEPNNPNEEHKSYTYSELLAEVCKMANVLKSLGVKKGDRVCIYLPMIPELAFSVLACARIGAIHSVVFAGFSSSALATRIDDCKSSIIITSDGSFRGEKILNLKKIVDDALEMCKSDQKVLLVKRTNESVNINSKRDFLLDDLIVDVDNFCDAEIMDAEDPLFILYTSGSTGKPKGVMHTSGGYLVYVSHTHELVFDYHPDDVYWCTADIGWITGHSYIVYGPLSNAVTQVIFEGVPNYPDFGRFWQIVEQHKVNIFYTAPTALRALMKEGDDWVTKYDLSSLKVLGTVGEPIKSPEWHWYFNVIGNEKCPIVDTWWQTETGGILMSPIPGCVPTKPGSATLPLPGIVPAIFDEQGNEITDKNTTGYLVMTQSWPGQMRTVYGDHQRFIDTYFSQAPGNYFTGDGAYIDNDGYFWITGRVDDVLNVSGHRIGTAEVEGAIGAASGVAEAAVIGYNHEIKGEGIYAFVTLMTGVEASSEIEKDILNTVTKIIGPHAKPSVIQFCLGLPKTRSGKIMRRILRNIASKQFDNLGDISTLLNPDVVKEIIDNSL